MMINVRLSLLFVLCAACTVGEDPGEDSVAGDGVVSEPAPSSDPASIEARVCATGTTTMGVDVSYYEGTVDWAKAYTAGVRFAFIRLSDGTVFRDPKFVQNWANAKTAGVIRGAYQFFRPNQSATAQADMMIAAIGTYQPGDLPPVIDVETTDGLGPATVAARVKTWMERVKAGLGVDPIVYTGMYFWRDQVGNLATYAANPLWIAQYTSAACPNLPSVWSSWAFWQHSDTAHISGISGGVDQSWFNGSADALLAFASAAAAPAPTPDPPPPTPPTGTCHSDTLGTDVPAGACVQRASDGSWWQCSAGGWDPKTAPDASCSPSYPL